MKLSLMTLGDQVADPITGALYGITMAPAISRVDTR